ILRFARERNVTKIVVGKPKVLRLRDRFGRSFVDELLLASGDIDIYATVGEAEKVEPAPPIKRAEKEHPFRGYLAAILVAAAASLLSFVLFGRRELADVVMIYLLGIVLIATRFGFRASVAGGVLSVLAFDLLFVPPYLTFSVADFRHIITFG